MKTKKHRWNDLGTLFAENQKPRWNHLIAQFPENILAVEAVADYIDKFKHEIRFKKIDAENLAERVKKGPKISLIDIPNTVLQKHRQHLVNLLNKVVVYYEVLLLTHNVQK